MASRKEPKIASPGALADPAKGKKKPTVEAPPAKLEDLAPGADPSAFVARLCPVDIPGSVKVLATYHRDRNAFKKIDEEAKSARGVMNAAKKELCDKGWEKDAISFAMKLSDMDPEYAQKVLAQTFVLCRSKVLDVPLGVVNGVSGDLFDPDRVYRFGKLNSDAAKAAETRLVDPATLPSGSETERMADIFENGRSQGLKGEHMKYPPGIEGDEKAEQSYRAGWTRGQSDLLAKGGKQDGDNVVSLQTKPPAYSTVEGDEPLPQDAAALGIG